jgi:hypothetical protein
MNDPSDLQASRLYGKANRSWLVLLLLPFTERALPGAESYYFLYIGLGLVFVMYRLTIRSIVLTFGIAVAYSVRLLEPGVMTAILPKYVTVSASRAITACSCGFGRRSRSRGRQATAGQ